MEEGRGTGEATLWVALGRDRRVLAIALAVVGVGMLALAFGPGFVLVRASTANATVSWVIPTDRSMTISFPTAQVDIRFQPALSTFAEQIALSQTDAVAAVRVTNAGNVNINVAAAFTGTFPTGVAEFRIANASVSNAPSGAQRMWCGATSDTGQSPAGICSGTQNATTSWTIWTGLTPGSHFDKWSWSWGTAVAAGTQTDTWQLTSS